MLLGMSACVFTRGSRKCSLNCIQLRRVSALRAADIQPLITPHTLPTPTLPFPSPLSLPFAVSSRPPMQPTPPPPAPLHKDFIQVGIDVASGPVPGEKKNRHSPPSPLKRRLGCHGVYICSKCVFLNFNLSTPQVFARRKHRFAKQVWAISRLSLLPPAIRQDFSFLSSAFAKLSFWPVLSFEMCSLQATDLRIWFDIFSSAVTVLHTRVEFSSHWKAALKDDPTAVLF